MSGRIRSVALLASAVTMFGVLIGGAGSAGAVALSDTQAPTVTSYQVFPPALDVTHGDGQATVVLRVQDQDGAGNPGSGFAEGSLTLSNGTDALDPISFASDDMVDGTTTDGTYDLFVDLPQGQAPGSYTATDITLTDVAANTSHSTNSTALVVTRTADTTPPAVSGSLSVSPTTIDVTEQSRDVVYAVTLTDAVSGVTDATLDLAGPDVGFGPQTAQVGLSLATGTVNNGTWTGAQTYFPAEGAGTWTATGIELTDGYGNTTETAPTGGSLTVHQTIDTVPPTVSSVIPSPSTIDTTSTAQSVTVNVAASDATSGIASGDLEFISPSSDEYAFGEFGTTPATGTFHNGTYAVEVDFPARAEAGTWTLDSIDVTDVQGNVLSFTPGDAGLPDVSITVKTSADTTGPTLGSFVVGPAQSTTAYGGDDLHGQLVYDDAVSGFTRAVITFKEPDGAVSDDVSTDAYVDNRGPTDTPQHGTTPFDVYIGSSEPAGVWTVNSVELDDVAGNTHLYTTAQLATAGFATQFTVQSTATDTQAPNLTALSISPTSVDTTTGAQMVTVTAGVHDPDAVPSGVSDVELVLASPSQQRYVYFSLALVSGNSATGTYQDTESIGKFTESGTWTVSEVDLSDLANHERTLLGGDLAAAGLTTTLAVTAAGDTIAPTLTGVTLDTATINTASTSDLEFHVAATDAGSGVTEVDVQLAGPGGQTELGSSNINPAASTNTEVDVPIPTYNSAGSWTTSAVILTDAVGNTHTYTASDLGSLSLSRTAVVTSAADTTSPAATALRFAPSPVDTTSGPVDVDVTMHLTDAGSGVALAGVSVTSPHGSQTRHADLSLVAGSSQDGYWQGTLKLPKYVDPGTWVVGPLTAADAVGNALTMSSAQLSTAGMPGTLAVSGPPDTDQPVLTSLTVSPSSVDTTTGDKSLTLTAAATDGQSGVAAVDVTVTPPVGDPQSVFMTLQSGTPASSTYTGSIFLPAYSAIGQWSVGPVVVHDVYGNAHTYTHADLVALPVTNPTFTLTGTPDTTGPALTGLTLSSSTIDVSAGARSITGTVTATDSGSGVSDGELTYTSPNGKQSVTVNFDAADRTSGTAANPTIPISFQLPAFSQAGTWALSEVEISDVAGNLSGYPPTALPVSGVVAALTVVDTNQDVTPPAVSGLTATPSPLDVHAAPGSLTVDVHLTDAGSGVSTGEVELVSPSGQDHRSVEFDGTNRISGTAADGIYQVSFPFSTATESGTWQFSLADIIDNAGNSASYTGTQIPTTHSVQITGTPIAPAAPTEVMATPANQSADVDWTAPSNGGSPITGYLVIPSKAGVAQTPIAVGTTTDTTVTGLTNGTAYTFTVEAKNAIGTGAASAPSNQVIPAPTAPGRPVAVSASAGDQSIGVTWSAPTDTGGSPISGYVIATYTQDGTLVASTGVGNVTSDTVTGLTNGVAYYVSVRATNGVDTGDSSYSTVVTPVSSSATAPGAPTIGTAVANGATGATVSWTAPASTGGSPILDYAVLPYIGSTLQSALAVTTGGSASSATVSGLAKGSTYTFKVEASNSLGVGPLSAASNALAIPATAPDSPTGVSATAGAGSAVVSWTAPTNDGGSSITGYAVTPTAGGIAGTPVLVGNVHTTTIAGLIAGAAYTFTVHAVNSVGSSGESAPSTAVVPTAALPVSTLTISSLPPTATYGSPITVIGSLTSGASKVALGGQSVVLQYRKQGSTGAFTSVGSAALSTSSGVVTFSGFKPATSVQVQLSYSGTDTNAAAISAPKTVSVGLKITAKLKSASIKKGKSTTLSGVVSPAAATKSAELQKLTHGRWVNVLAVKVKSGRLSVAIKGKTKGSIHYRIFVKGSPSFAASTSAALVLKVR